MKNEKTLLLAVYKEGPGTQGEIKGVLDGAIGGTYQERIELMYEKLTERTASWLEDDPDVNIRVVSVGFSRGAEQAAGFSRLLHERGIRSVEDEKQVLRAPGTTPQALGLYDPVATGTPHVMTGALHHQSFRAFRLPQVTSTVPSFLRLPSLHKENRKMVASLA